MSVVRQAHHERKMKQDYHERHGTVNWSFLNPLILSLSKDGGTV